MPEISGRQITFFDPTETTPCGLLFIRVMWRCRTFGGFESIIADAWARCPARARSQPLIVTAIGWLEKRKGVAGLLCQSTDGMAPEEFVDSHCFGMEIAGGFPESREVQRLADAPIDSTGLPRLHKLCSTAAERQSRGGKLGGVCVGGRMLTARVDRDGARVIADADLDALAAA